MRFRLLYAGPLKANGGPGDKQAIRRQLHPQLMQLWQQKPLSYFAEPNSQHNYLDPSPADPGHTLIFPVGPFQFAALVSERINLICELQVLFLRREEPGSVVTQGGDIDNRIKTLLDALRFPKNASELPTGDQPGLDEAPFFCLLEDDNLITRLDVVTDRLLTPGPPSDVHLIMHIETRPTVGTWGNVALI